MADRYTRIAAEVAGDQGGDPNARFTRASMEVALEPGGVPNSRYTRVSMEVCFLIPAGGVNAFGAFGRCNWLAAQPVSKT